MGGYLELYKTDSTKIKEQLYHKLTADYLPEIYNANMEEWYGTFQNFIKSRKHTFDYRHVSYERIIEKLQKDYFLLEQYEFMAILEWFTFYYESEVETHENFLSDHGLISIGTLGSRYEMTIFFGLGCDGILTFYFPLEKPRSFWNDGIPPLNAEETILVIDYLILLCIKIAEIDQYPHLEELKSDLDEDNLKNNLNLNISASQHIESYLLQKQNGSDDRDMKHLFEGGYNYIPGILSDLKKNLAGYGEMIYKDDLF